MQIPIMLRSLKPNQKVGVICANGRVLSSMPALEYCGVDDLSQVIIGAEVAWFSERVEFSYDLGE